MIQTAIDTFGRLDVLVNNAGIETRQSLLDTTEEGYDKVMAVNMKSAFFGTQAAAKQFIAQDGAGSILNISSVHEDWPMPGNIAYCVSKGGMRMLARTAGVELGPHGIRVVNVAPGAVDTPINAETTSDQAHLGKLNDAIPLHRVARARRHRRRRRLPRLRQGRLHDRDHGRGRRRHHAGQRRPLATRRPGIGADAAAGNGVRTLLRYTRWSVGAERSLRRARPRRRSVARRETVDRRPRAVAQLVEQRSPKPQVAGSSPVRPANRATRRRTSERCRRGGTQE